MIWFTNLFCQCALYSSVVAEPESWMSLSSSLSIRSEWNWKRFLFENIKLALINHFHCHSSRFALSRLSQTAFHSGGKKSTHGFWLVWRPFDVTGTCFRRCNRDRKHYRSAKCLKKVYLIQNVKCIFSSILKGMTSTVSKQIFCFKMSPKDKCVDVILWAWKVLPLQWKFPLWL